MSVIEIELKSPDKLPFVVDLLRSLTFVERVEVHPEDTPSSPAEPSTSLSAKHWGAWKNNPISAEKIDDEIRNIREEWDRDIF